MEKNVSNAKNGWYYNYDVRARTKKKSIETTTAMSSRLESNSAWKVQKRSNLTSFPCIYIYIVTVTIPSMYKYFYSLMCMRLFLAY